MTSEKITKRVSHQLGFTLIELLVVLAIIGLMSSIFLSAVGVIRARGRDANRKATLHQLQAAIELYRANNNGSYPGTQGTTIFTTETTFCTAMTPYLADACNKLRDPLLGSYVFMMPLTGGYFIGSRFEVPPPDYQFAMYWASYAAGEPPGLFYMYLIN